MTNTRETQVQHVLATVSEISTMSIVDVRTAITTLEKELTLLRMVETYLTGQGSGTPVLTEPLPPISSASPAVTPAAPPVLSEPPSKPVNGTGSLPVMNSLPPPTVKALTSPASNGKKFPAVQKPSAAPPRPLPPYQPQPKPAPTKDLAFRLETPWNSGARPPVTPPVAEAEEKPTAPTPTERPDISSPADRREQENHKVETAPIDAQPTALSRHLRLSAAAEGVMEYDPAEDEARNLKPLAKPPEPSAELKARLGNLEVDAAAKYLAGCDDKIAVRIVQICTCLQDGLSSAGAIEQAMGLPRLGVYKYLSDKRVQRFVHRAGVGRYELTADGKGVLEERAAGYGGTALPNRQ